MNRCRFYIDEDAMHAGLVEGLRSQGFRVVSAAEAGMRRRDDPDQLAYAVSQGQVLFSFNVSHFHSIHTNWMTEGRPHAGIVLGYQRRWPVREQIRRAVHLAAVLSAEEMRNRLEFLGNW